MSSNIASGLVYPPLDYSVTLYEICDFHLQHNPSHTGFMFSKDVNSACTDISLLEFGKAVHRVAHFIRPASSVGVDRQTVAFVALSDTLLYHAITLGIIRAGYIPYPMSPRNTATAIIKLMKDTACHRLLTTQQTLRSLVEDIQGQLASSDPDYAIKIDEVPLLSSIFPRFGQKGQDNDFERYPSAPRRPLTDVVMYLHSSGSTGLPKTIPQTFKSMVDWASFPPVTEVKGYGTIFRRLAGHALPPFHTLGIIAQLLSSLYSLVPIGLFPPIATAPHLLPVIPTPGIILDHMTWDKCNSLVTIPALLQVWSQDKKAVDILAQLEFVAFSGGSVPPKLGDFMISSGVRITQIYGGTEFGATTCFFRDQADLNDWEYVRFHDRCAVRWQPQGDGTFECQYLTVDGHQLSMENLQDTKGYATSDLFVQHPTKPSFWKLVGRKDDVILHTSGEKTVPGPIEDVLTSSPFIMGVVIFGQNREQPGALIELKQPYEINVENEHAVTEVRNTLWPVFEEANKVAPSFSRIFKEMILFVSKNKPLPRSGKGTVLRKAALKEYQIEIDEIYKKVETTVNVGEIAPPASWNAEDISSWLLAQMSEIIRTAFVEPDRDLFEQGMDSLGAMILRRRIVGAITSAKMQKASQVVSQAAVYEYPSIKKLATFLERVVKDPDGFLLTTSKAKAMDLLIEKYSAGLTAPITSSHPPQHDKHVVLLTGSTGYLGSQVLRDLLADVAVSRIYALNRPSASSKSVQQRQAERFCANGLDTSLLDTDRLTYLEGQTSRKGLGLDEAVYEELRSRTTIIIHNAWRLDFNLNLSSFETHIQGIRNLIDLARSGTYASHIKFIFTSSVLCASSWDKSRGAYPEEVIENLNYAVGTGYGESKYIAERILGASGLHATSLRIAQISGGLPSGAWATTDWFPILVKSSITMKIFPDMNGVASWVPMDSVASAILDIAHSTQNVPAALNIVHPHAPSWRYIISSVNSALVAEGVLEAPLPLVDMQQWLTVLREYGNDSTVESITVIPAVKLLDFFSEAASINATIDKDNTEQEVNGLPTFSTDKMQSISQTVQSLPQVGVEDAQRWVKYWTGVGFLA